MTGAGLWFILLALVVAVSATNTGNNALFMVLALMLGLLVVSGLVSRWNVRSLHVELKPPAEIYARRPATLRFKVANAARWLPRWLLLFSLDGHDRPRLIPYLPRRGRSRGELELLFPRRGIHRLEAAVVASLFPFGFFTKSQSYAVEQEVLVYPELFAASGHRPRDAGSAGEDGSDRRGRGFELHQLRPFRPGDDPRDIHWKQTAKVGQPIFVERQEEEGRRVSILFDNGCSPLPEGPDRERFEQLVSEAATAACDFLDQGLDLELVTRGGRWPFGSGRRQRYAVLEALALIEPVPAEGEPLHGSDPRAPMLRLALDRREAP
ncbi:MAG: DUF58 domain-containing protein [Acidobacteria bacterium]|nr:DUF58 domain-containing protein [Acidobacteriota bacterium]